MIKYLRSKAVEFLGVQGVIDAKITKAFSRSDEERFFGPSHSSDRDSSILRRSEDYLRSFQLFNYVGTCVSTIARDVSRMGHKVVNQSGEEVKAPRIIELLKNPFQELTYRQLIQQCVVHLLLDGNCFLLLNESTLADSRKKTFSQIIPLNPSLVEVLDDSSIIVNSTTARNSYAVSVYRCMIGNSQKDISKESIQHAKLLGPHNVLRGMGVIQQNAPSLDSDRFTTLYNNLFFKNGARSNVMISPKDDEGFNPDSWKDTVDKMTKKYTGWENQAKPWFLPLGVEVHPLNISQNDMQFIDQLKLTRENVNSFFKIPPVISQLYEHAKYDSADQQLEAYYKVTIPGWASPIEEALTGIIQRIDPSLSFVFVMPNKISSQDAKEMFDRGVITGNEYRANYGLHVIDSEKTLENRYMLMNYMPVDAVGNEDSPPLPAPQKEEKIYKEKEEILEKAGPSVKQSLIHTQAIKTKAVVSKRIASSVANYYTALEKRTMRALDILDKSKQIPQFKADGPEVEDIFDFKEEVKEAKRLGKNMIQSGVSMALNDINNMLGSKVDNSTKNSKLRLVVEKLSTRYASQTIDSRRDEIRKILSSSIQEGVPISEIKGRLQDHFIELRSKDGWMATRIARTEASYAWDQGAKLCYDELKIKKCDVIGCEDSSGDCNAKGVDIEDIDRLEFHPNHTGTIVPA